MKKSVILSIAAVAVIAAGTFALADHFKRSGGNGTDIKEVWGTDKK